MKDRRNIFRLQCEPRSSISREVHRTRLIEYDDRMRQEVMKYSRLLMELNKSSWFTHHASNCDGVDQSSPQRNGKLNGFVKYTVNDTMNEDISSGIEMTRLSGDEILHSDGLTMDNVILKKKRPLELLIGGNKNQTSTQHTMAFQSTLTPQERNDLHSARIEMIQTVSQDSCESRGRESLPWESVKVEFAGLVLQGWRGVNSFSSSTLCSRDRDDIDVTYHPSSEKQCSTASPASDRRRG